MDTRALFAFSLAALLSAPQVAIAQSSIAARRVLISQAGAAQAAGDHTRALDLATRAGQIEMTPSLRMFIAQEQNALGQFAAAMGSADACMREVNANPATQHRDEIHANCSALLTDIQHHIGMMTVRVPATRPAGLEITVGGEPLVEALYNVASVVTPGRVVVEARRAGQVLFHREVTVETGHTADVEVVLPIEQPVAAAIVAPPPAIAHPPEHHLPVGAFVVGGVGAAALIASAGTFVASRIALGNCSVTATEIDCPSTMDAARARPAPAEVIASDVLLGVGAAAVVGAVIWLVVDRTSSPGSHRAQLQVSPFAGGATIALTGSFQ